MFNCPVCGYDQLRDPPKDYTICPCCGTEFDYHDASPAKSPSEMHIKLRRRWIDRGMDWWFHYEPAPPNWDPVEQLKKANLT